MEREVEDDFFGEMLVSISAARTAFDIFKALKTVCDHYSFRYFIVLEFGPPEGEAHTDRAILSNWETEFLYNCLRDGLLFRLEPLSRGRHESLPRSFTVSPEDQTGENGAGGAAKTFHEHGHECIAFFPLCAGGEGTGAIGFSGQRKELSLREVMTLTYLCLHIHDVLARVTDADGHNSNPLSNREIQCLRGAASGLTTEEIAEEIGITPHTVNYHSTNAVRKLGGRNRVHAVALAIRKGWLDLRM